MSGGPKTDTGKAVARMNATAHGLRAVVPVVPGEDVALWDEHRESVVASFAVMGAAEAALAERVALLLWRLGRVARFETESIALAQEDVDTSIAHHWKYSSEPDETTEYGRSLAQVRETVEEAADDLKRVRRFETLTDDRMVKKADALDLISALTSEAGIDEEEFDYPVPGLAADATFNDVRQWTAGMVRACLHAIAVASEQTVDDLLGTYRRRREYTLYRASFVAARWERQASRLRRERTLPNPQDLDRVMRYEAHLHRQMTQTLHELEAMQERRRGHAAPLARLDLSGIGTEG